MKEYPGDFHSLLMISKEDINRKKKLLRFLSLSNQEIESDYDKITPILDKLKEWDLLLHSSIDENDYIAFQGIFHLDFVDSLRSSLLLILHWLCIDSGNSLRKALESFITGAFLSICFPEDKGIDYNIFEILFHPYKYFDPRLRLRTLQPRDFFTTLENEYGQDKSDSELLEYYLKHKHWSERLFFFLKPICISCFRSNLPIVEIFIGEEITMEDSNSKGPFITFENDSDINYAQIVAKLPQCSSRYCKARIPRRKGFVVYRPGFFLMIEVIGVVLGANYQPICDFYKALSEIMVHISGWPVDTKANCADFGLDFLYQFLEVLDPLVKGTINFLEKS